MTEPHEIQALATIIDNGIGSDDEDECGAASDALLNLADIAEEAASDAQRLREAIYDASRL